MKIRLEFTGTEPPDFPLDLELLSDEISRALAPVVGEMNANAALTFVSDGEMKNLNARYRDTDEPTDVLSFPLWEEEGRFAPPGWDELPLGDVVVSPDFVRRNAGRENIGYNNEMARMVVHGVLHLVGFDHDTEDRRAAMWEIQERAVANYACKTNASGED
ncbi:MAG: rRNA maturation RNase YbeY [Synergistaceae bacterium]|nr:rRNA maturation RNase YbeY [Synergistaceae bacterium]